MDKTYGQGLLDGIQLYGKVCGHKSSCRDCAISYLKGEELSCQEFMEKYPQKMLSLLKEMNSKKFTYFDEYTTRFPNCTLSLEDAADILCRKAIFEGYVTCEGKDCKECWSEEYIGDVSEKEEE